MNPEIIKLDDRTEYRYNNKLHRDDGPAVIMNTGSEFWYLNSQLHREDGPALIWANGIKEYWQNGKLHRLDGPAIIYNSGKKKYYINDIEYSEDHYRMVIFTIYKKNFNES